MNITVHMLPILSNLNMMKNITETSTTCIRIKMNCVIKWVNIISTIVTPATIDRSQTPSIRSLIMIVEVIVVPMKNIMLFEKETRLLTAYKVFTLLTTLLHRVPCIQKNCRLYDRKLVFQIVQENQKTFQSSCNL